MSFDYFYGPDDAEQYSFYRIPKRLITGDEFQETSTEAKLTGCSCRSAINGSIP